MDGGRRQEVSLLPHLSSPTLSLFAHLRRQKLGGCASKGAVRAQLLLEFESLGPRGQLQGCPVVLGGPPKLCWGRRRIQGGKLGAHLILVGGQVLSSQQVALYQMNAVVHRGADQDGQGDGFHSAHLPATPVHDGHHEADDACEMSD